MLTSIDEAVGFGPNDIENSVAEITLPKELAPMLCRFFPKDNIIQFGFTQ